MKIISACYSNKLYVSGVGRHTCKEAWEGPVDPASDNDHGQNVGDISLHHVSHHWGIWKANQRKSKPEQTNHAT